MAFWAVIDSDNRIRGTGFNAFSALISANIRDTDNDDIPDLDDIPKAGVMHTIAELKTGLEGTQYRFERITEDEYWADYHQNREKEQQNFMNGIVRRFF